MHLPFPTSHSVRDRHYLSTCDAVQGSDRADVAARVLRSANAKVHPGGAQDTHCSALYVTLSHPLYRHCHALLTLKVCRTSNSARRWGTHVCEFLLRSSYRLRTCCQRQSAFSVPNN